MKTIITENQRGLLFHNGKLITLLNAGKYRTFGEKKIELVSLEQPLASQTASLDILLKNPDIAANTTVIDVSDEELAIHFVNGRFTEALTAGTYAFWTVYDKHTFTRMNMTEPESANEIPKFMFPRIPAHLYTKVEVAEYMKARLYYNKRLVRLLDSGIYYFWQYKTNVTSDYVDTRLTRLTITGQEILSKDKVSLRINFVCNYKITDYTKVLTEIDDYEEQLHLAAQLALREYTGRYTIDELLENKDEISAQVFEKLKRKAAEFYVDITDAGIRDIILPGEIREIMNSVLVAEKRAQANVITRREEVASTRSLLNTAKLMDENRTLYKLKELEYLERICENVGNISVNGNADLLSQLNTIMRGGNAN
ncbi:MAG: slipin family protein [Lachnospiraceae bacterium]|nr:slipin family protein [Lachnospiraceae bacterium]